MIITQDITKLYGKQKALDKVSFEIKDHTIVGILGPNGAGKTTLLRILTGYMPPTEGRAELMGIDIRNDIKKIQKNIGYLPEHNPLYLSMYIKEFLNFVANIYKIGNKKQRIDEVIEMVGLQNEINKKINQLSKGYRQRVGLAKVMLHDPPILILDEPTSGLDPNQIIEIRDLIKTLGKKKTVLLSTHIMQEVEYMCDRVIILNNGKIVADSLTKDIGIYQANQIKIEVRFDKRADVNFFNSLIGVISYQALPNNSYEILAENDAKVNEQIFEKAIKNNLKILELKIDKLNVEDVFHHLTQ
ncbi:MAG: ATP-binding cassette domain-containing protein [Bacteroidales bacterium]|nr:ATP-binding cassette domain-containing protein [Bacteroidales bacterium]